MPEYIERSQLLEHVKDLPTWGMDDDSSTGPTLKYPDGMFYPEDVTASIENASAADVEPVSGWISVEDRLPETECPVLAYYHFANQKMQYMKMQYMNSLTFFAFDEKPHWQHESTGLVVTHWMPLPDPPEN